MEADFAMRLVRLDKQGQANGPGTKAADECARALDAELVVAVEVQRELIYDAGRVLELFTGGSDGTDAGALETAVGVQVVEDRAEVGGSAVEAAGAGDLSAAGQGDGPGGLVAVAKLLAELDGEGEQDGAHTGSPTGAVEVVRAQPPRPLRPEG